MVHSAFFLRLSLASAAVLLLSAPPASGVGEGGAAASSLLFLLALVVCDGMEPTWRRALFSCSGELDLSQQKMYVKMPRTSTADNINAPATDATYTAGTPNANSMPFTTLCARP